MQFLYSALAILLCISWIGTRGVYAVPLNQTELDHDENDPSLAEDYANLKYDLIHNLGYSEEFADAVEINLKRAVRQERERQRHEGILSSSLKPDLQRQGNQQVSEEYDDEETTPAGPTTPGASPGDVVRGVAGIITSLGTFNLGNFWNSFVNFFPPNQREGAQAVVESSLGRRPSKWPTLPTTTTKLTTTTKDEDEIDSEETTKSAVTAAPAGATATVALGTATAAPVAAAPVASVTEAGTRAPTTRYTLRRRTGTELPSDADFETTGTPIVGITNEPSATSGTALGEDDEIELLSAYSSSSTTLATGSAS